jgi:hypothetical protein
MTTRESENPCLPILLLPLSAFHRPYSDAPSRLDPGVHTATPARGRRVASDIRFVVRVSMPVCERGNPQFGIRVDSDGCSL